MRILGVDIGNTSIKAVELDSSFGRFQIHEYHEQPLPQSGDRLLVLGKLLQGLARQPDRIAVAMRTSEVTFRDLQLPTRDRKAIQSSIGFELEDELPFSLDDAVYDYAIISQAKKSSFVHVATTLKRYIISTLTAWKQLGFDPDLFTTEAWSLRTYMNRFLPPAEQEKPVLVAIAGDQRTIVYGHWRGVPVFCHEFSWGGQDITAAIHKKYGISLEQAEQAKLNHGFVIPENQKPGATPEQIIFSDTLLESIEPLIAEIRQAEFSCKAITHHRPSALYLSGGTSLLPGLIGTLEENARLPVRQLRALSAISGTDDVTYSENPDAKFLLASACALNLVGPDRATTINFRKGQFSKKSPGQEFTFAALKAPLLATTAIAFSLIVSLVVQSSIYKSKLQDVNQQLEKSVRVFFDQALGTPLSGSAIKTYMSNTSSLKNTINKEVNKRRELSQLLSPNPHSPLSFLRDLSTAIPRDIVVDMTQFQVGAAPTASYLANPEQGASLAFLLNNPQAATRLNSILSSKLSRLEKGKIDEVDTADGKRWKVVFSGKPTEESYGK